MNTSIPISHVDLLRRPIPGVLTTMMLNGQPQSSLVWCDFDGECARVHTSRERQKGKNMLSNPKVSLLIVDPENTGRFLQIRGDAELTEEGAWNSSIRLHVSIQTTRAITVMSSRWKKKARNAHHLPYPRQANHIRCNSLKLERWLSF